MRKFLILSILVLLSLNFVLGATESLVEFTYDFNSTSETITNKIHNPPILLKIKTTENPTNCYWNTQENSVFGYEPNKFEWEGIGTHEQRFYEEELKNGLNDFYIQCGNSSNPLMKVSFDILKEISAKISLSEEDPLKAGTYEVIFETSRPTLGTPTLEYSVDNIVYDPLPLEKVGNNWKATLIIDNSLRETVGSFKFKATDSAGRVGTRIEGESTFLIDTVSPSPVEDFEAIGYLGEIELSWYLDDEIDEYIIFRSDNPGVTKNNEIERTRNDDFLDTDVENGETYYYRIQAIDKAGNKGSLSREISATALRYETDEETGLSQNLLGKVDNLLTEISLLEEDIQTIQIEIKNKEEKEKNLFEELNLNKEITNTLSELNSLEKDVERYKLQDLTELELNTKLNQARLRIDILEKKIPESLTVIDEFEMQREISPETIDLMILEYGQETMSEKEQRRTNSLTLELIDKTSTTVKSKAYSVEINYLDGSSNEKTIIRDTISGELDKRQNVKILLSIPEDIVSKASEIEFTKGNEEVIKESTLLGFDSDTKEIVYVIDKEINPSQIEDIKILPLEIYQEEISNRGFLTGFVTFQGTEISNSYLGIALGIIVIILLALYFVIMKKNKSSEELIKINALIKQGKNHKKEGAKKELKELYLKIKDTYRKLSKKEKEKIYKKIKKLHE